MAADASDYPTNADSIPRTNPSDNLTGHSDLHDKMADAIEEIQGFVGVSGDTTAGTIVKRVSDLEAAPPAHNHDATYYTETEVDTLLAGKQDSGSYAATTHTHSYAPTTHTHAYASDTHNHDTSYASAGHTHSYASTTHNHDTSYASAGHSHTSFSSDVTFTSGTGQYSDSAALQVTGSSASIALRANGAASNSSQCVQMRSGQNGGDLRAMLYVTQHDGNSPADIECYRLYYNGGNVGSSRTIKENIVPAFAADNYDAVELVKQLDTSTFNYIDGSPDDVQLGLIAEDVFEVAPDFVELRDGTPRYLKQSIHFLTLAALRQAVTKIETLEARIAELEG